MILPSYITALILSQAGMSIGEPVPTACSPGIYAVATDGSLVALPQTKADHRKVTGMLGAMLLGPIGGGKMKVKTVLPGANAAIKLTKRPVFRLCFDTPAAITGTSSDYVGVSAAVGLPRDYQLVRFEQANDQRELVLSSVGGFAGPQGQISKSEVSFQSDILVPGQYRVTVSRDLLPGQYGFLHEVSATASTRKKDVQEQVYDFAVID